ncbi:PPE family protein, SVP subgroup [[Mycobacterium] crassicus]|uniref:PE domain-containing protein n=1 Tax=[Mycobacterium] crassicus TaxID=2872309 RepID=A0ABU5XH97_9MYCO|nr:PE domain-containing protein [Mycolicibacter sp. MYC098]MEB3021258.1 PE domain-containing protein [Mycolicibacter sp. MYC098]
MSFVTTQPEALAAAANNLQTIGAAMTAQNTAAATPTTGVAPAAADEVSALQATQFSAYGTLYQQISAQATAIQEMFVQTLRTSSESYDATETANATGNGAADSPLTDLINLLTGSASGPYNLFSAALSNGGIAGAMQASNFGSAASDLLQLGSAGFLSPGHLASSSVTEALPASVLTNASSDVAPVSVVTGGQSAPTGKLSAPPSWGGAAGPAAPAARLANMTTAAGEHTSTSTVPAGIPAAASADRKAGGRLRYGVKPKVAPRATGV